MKVTRREFFVKASGGAAALSLGASSRHLNARSYAHVIGANDRFHISIMGVNARGNALAGNFARQANCRIDYICDVDRRAIEKCISTVVKTQQETPKGEKDFRKSLEDKEVDALVIAAPDHWHAPAALLAVEAGKDVYLEKPCSHSPREGEMLVEGARKYKRIVQLGTQRRSWPHVIEAMQELQSGIIGRAYFAKGWYANNRKSIGFGKETAVPDWLDYNLWQGPAPRKPYRDNLIHYNWHWFWHWGTGEALNNGTHMLDMMRWGLGVKYPTRVSSSGGRFHFKDDWETPDTQVIALDFAENVSMVWEGRSCSGRTIDGSSAGVIFHGEKGSLLIDGNSYVVQDLDEKVIKEVKESKAIDPRNTVNPTEGLDAVHIRNFLEAVRGSARLNAEIEEGHRSTLLCQLGNIAQRAGRSLKLNPQNGHILEDQAAQLFWSRSYERGWEMKL
jgi:predicted dehydrogenase